MVHGDGQRKSCLLYTSLSEYDDWVLDIYGQDDGEKKRLNALIKENNMQGRITVSYTHLDVYKRQSYNLPKAI